MVGNENRGPSPYTLCDQAWGWDRPYSQEHEHGALETGPRPKPEDLIYRCHPCEEFSPLKWLVHDSESEVAARHLGPEPELPDGTCQQTCYPDWHVWLDRRKGSSQAMPVAAAGDCFQVKFSSHGLRGSDVALESKAWVSVARVFGPRISHTFRLLRWQNQLMPSDWTL